MLNILLIALGSAIGGVCRYGLSANTYALLGRGFPYGTLAVNTIGSFLAGLIFVLLAARFNDAGEPLRALLIIGFLGGFTTFSAFSLGTFNLIETGEILQAALNIALSVILSIGFTFVGAALGRQL